MNIKYLEQCNINVAKITYIDTQIDALRLKTLQIDINNTNILSIQKRMYNFPKPILELISNTKNLEDEYKNTTNNLIKFIIQEVQKQSTSHLNQNMLDDMLNSQTFKTYENIAKKHFISQELLEYKRLVNIDENELIERQTVLENENNCLKNNMKNIKNLENEIKQIELNTSTIKIQIKQVENDISNLESNKLLDDEIAASKTKIEKYEKRIESTESLNVNLNNILILIDKYDKLHLVLSNLNNSLHNIEELISKFEKYKDHIEHNIIIKKRINEYKSELFDLETVIEEVEKQYNTETNIIIKSNVILEQIKKDIAETREIEIKFNLYTIYRKALKTLPYILLSKIQPLLEKKVNDLLSIISDFTLKFDMTDNKIDIYIDRSIYRVNIEKHFKSTNKLQTIDRHILVNNASGFERFISSLAIRIALLDISNLPKISCMAIDEGWSCFDNTNLNNVSIILDFLKQKFDFILTITHLNEIKQHCDISIGLLKDNEGFSSIVI